RIRPVLEGASRYKAASTASAVQTRLRGLIEELTAGGKQAIAVALDQANAYLKQQYPQPAVLGADDYVRTVQSADGRKLVEFVRDQGDGTSMAGRGKIRRGHRL